MSAPGQTIGVSAFTDSLLDALAISRDRLSLAYMVGTMMSAVMLTRAGKFFDKYGAVRTGIFASIGLGVALIYMSQIDKLTQAIGSHKMISFFGVFFGFIFIRFFGQGVLTLTSRTMVVKWFDEKRGLAVGILSVVTAYGFSMAPVVFDYLIQNGSWSTAWIKIGLTAGLLFPLVILLFFKDGPEKYGLQPDGVTKSDVGSQKKTRFPVYKEFTLNEARKTLSLWVFSLLPAMFGLIVTAFSFHVVSIFAESGFSRSEAINIFQPIAAVAIVATLFFSWLSDYIKLKYLALMFAVTCMLSIFGIYNLSTTGINYWILIFGFGCSSGIHALIITVFLPRFYGKKYLGAITGQAMTVIVFASALGPIMFSLCLSKTGSYALACWVCAIVLIALFLAATFTNNPQQRFSS